MSRPLTSLKNQKALITGATSGIGLACAEVLASQGCNLVLTGRREERLKEISKRLQTEFAVKVTTLCFDLTDRQAVSESLGKAELSDISILINNAGLALGTELLQAGKFDDWEAMIDTNLKGLLYVTRSVLPKMIENKSGHLVNIGSVAGRWVYPGGGVYCATKFAVRALTESLRMDLMGTPLRVTNIEPGMVETEFSEVRFNGDQERAKNVYKNMTPLEARDIAETVLWCLQRPAHVNIQELVIYPTDQAGVGPSYTSRIAK
jgi:3-hydroxy acid dehydrogenase/malonic semialdehyde reductase